MRPLDDDLIEIPADGIVVNADSVETLVKAQDVKQTIQDLLIGNKLSFRELKRLMRTPPTQSNQSG